MSSSIDRILDILDSTHQTIPSPHRVASVDRFPGRCARCQKRYPAEGGELCQGCRAFLLEDSEIDPRQPSYTTPGSPAGAPGRWSAFELLRERSGQEPDEPSETTTPQANQT